MNRIKVLIVDDSAVVRQVMSGLLAMDPAIEVLGAAARVLPLGELARAIRDWGMMRTPPARSSARS